MPSDSYTHTLDFLDATIDSLVQNYRHTIVTFPESRPDPRLVRILRQLPRQVIEEL